MFSTNAETQERCHFFFSFSLPFLKLYRARHQRRQKREEHPNKACILHMTISTRVFHFVHCNEPFSFRNRSNQQLGNGPLLIKMYIHQYFWEGYLYVIILTENYNRSYFAIWTPSCHAGIGSLAAVWCFMVHFHHWKLKCASCCAIT